MLSLGLAAGQRSLGAFNVYATSTYAFSDVSVQAARSLAALITLTAAAVQERSDLRAALLARDVIGQAKGVLMERHKVTADRAFELLVAASQHTHRKLRDVAVELAASGQLPSRPD